MSRLVRVSRGMGKATVPCPALTRLPNKHVSSAHIHTTAAASQSFGVKDFEAVLRSHGSTTSVPAHPATVLPLPSPSGAIKQHAASKIRPGLAAALIDSISGMENKVATLVSREPMYSGKAAALNAGGGVLRRRRAGKHNNNNSNSDTLRSALDTLGMSASNDTVAPGAAGGKRINFQPETLRQVARSLGLGQSAAAKAAIQATVALRLGEQADRARREGLVRLAEAVRAAGGRSSESGAALSRVQSLAIARFLLQQHESDSGNARNATTPGATTSVGLGKAARDAIDVRAAKAAAAVHELPDAPFVLTRPKQSDSNTLLATAEANAPTGTATHVKEAATQLKEVFGDAHRTALVQALRSARQRQRTQTAAASHSLRQTSLQSAFNEWLAVEQQVEAELEKQLAEDGATEEEVALLREVHSARQTDRLAAAAAGRYNDIMTASRFNQPLPADAAGMDQPVLGADARTTLVRDDAKRAFVAWMSEQDRREKAFLAAATAPQSSAAAEPFLSVEDLRSIKGRIEQNRKIRTTALRRGDLYMKWGQLLARGYDMTVLHTEDSATQTAGQLQNIEED